MRRGIVIIVIVILLAVVGFAADALYASGAFKTITAHFDGSCRKVAIGSAESITIAPDGHYALVSADDRRSALSGHPVPGGIWLYDLTGAAPPRNLTPDASDEFHPHGIGLWMPDSGPARLFVIDHPDEGRKPQGEARQTVEVYEWQPEGGLVRKETLADPLLITPNAVVPVDADRFYVSNDHGPAGFLRNFDDFLALPRANVLYFDGTRFQVADSGIALANGVNVSQDGKTFYLASTLGRALLIYDRDPASGALSNRRSLPLGTAPDNVERAADGTLWIGAHPQLLKLLAYGSDAAKPSPSQVLKVTPDARGGTVEEVYLDAGGELGASSGGAVSGKHLLIASVFDDHFLDCTMR
jgi:arylesterase/paraoxonase